MKQRALSLLLAAGTVLSLAACQRENIESPAPAPTRPAATEPEPEYESGFRTVVIDGQELGVGLVMDEAPDAALDAQPDKDIDRAVTPIQPVFGTKLDGTPLTAEFYYYRAALDPTLQQAYDLLRAGMLEGKETIEMTVPVERAKIFELYKMVLFDSPELFWADVNGMRYYYNNRDIVTSVLPGYNDLAADIPGNTARLEQAVNEALADLWSLPTQAEKAKYAHDYLTYHNVYDSNEVHSQNLFSALVEGSTVCAGYSHAFQYLMQKMGIPCAYVLGYANGYHAWNVVLLDGEHYAMDVTWDDPLNAPPEKYSYRYFNLTDAALSADHTRMEISQSVPEALGTACNYPNAFGGNAYGTDFATIVGVMPEPVQPEQPWTGNPYLG